MKVYVVIVTQAQYGLTPSHYFAAGVFDNRAAAEELSARYQQVSSGTLSMLNFSPSITEAEINQTIKEFRRTTSGG